VPHGAQRRTADTYMSKTKLTICVRAFALAVAFTLICSAQKADGGRNIEWETLLPPKERGSYNPAPPPPVHDYLGEGDMAALQTGSFEVNPELNGLRVRLPGFVVPFE